MFVLGSGCLLSRRTPKQLSARSGGVFWKRGDRRGAPRPGHARPAEHSWTPSRTVPLPFRLRTGHHLRSRGQPRRPPQKRPIPPSRREPRGAPTPALRVLTGRRHPRCETRPFSSQSVGAPTASAAVSASSIPRAVLRGDVAGDVLSPLKPAWQSVGLHRLG